MELFAWHIYVFGLLDVAAVLFMTWIAFPLIGTSVKGRSCILMILGAITWAMFGVINIIWLLVAKYYVGAGVLAVIWLAPVLFIALITLPSYKKSKEDDQV